MVDFLSLAGCSPAWAALSHGRDKAVPGRGFFTTPEAGGSLTSVGLWTLDGVEPMRRALAMPSKHLAPFVCHEELHLLHHASPAAPPIAKLRCLVNHEILGRSVISGN